jgi:hypothetical protein
MHERQSQAWASNIIDADIHVTASFDFSHDVEKIQRILRSFSQVNQQLDDLSLSSIRIIELMSGMTMDEFQNELFRMSSTIESAIISDQESKSATCSGREKKPEYKRSAGRKRNWRAVSVARCCRRIWAEEEFASNPEKYGTTLIPNLLHPQGGTAEAEQQRQRFYGHLRNYAPQTQKHHRPGPFGRFLEDVFEVLGITQDDEQVVSAATALDSLKDLEHPE